MSPRLRDEDMIAEIGEWLRGRKDIDEILKRQEQKLDAMREEHRLTKIAAVYERQRFATEYMNGLKEAKAGGLL